MTDRVHSFTVVLEQPLRDDDAEAIGQAIGMIRGVLSVSTNVADVDFYAAHEMARTKLRDALFKALEGKPHG